MNLKKFTKKLSFLLLLSFLTVGTAFGQTTKYVDASVAASGDGSSAATAYKTIAEGFTGLAGGAAASTLIILPGTYDEVALATNQYALAQDLTIRTEGTGAVTLVKALQLSGTFTGKSLVIEAGANAPLEFQAALQTQAALTKIDFKGDVTVNTLTLGGAAPVNVLADADVTITTAFTANGAVINAGTLTFSGAYAVTANEAITNNAGATLTVTGNFNNGTGVITNNGTLTISGTVTTGTPSFGASSSTDIAQYAYTPGAALSIAAGQTLKVAALNIAANTLTNNGTLEIASLATATGSKVENSGTLISNGNFGTAAAAAPEVELTSGTLEVKGAGTFNAIKVLNAGSTLKVGTGIATIGANGLLNAAGTIDLGGKLASTGELKNLATLKVAGDLGINNKNIINSGTNAKMTVTGNLAIAAGGNIDNQAGAILEVTGTTTGVAGSKLINSSTATYKGDIATIKSLDLNANSTTTLGGDASAVATINIQDKATLQLLKSAGSTMDGTVNITASANTDRYIMHGIIAAGTKLVKNQGVLTVDKWDFTTTKFENLADTTYVSINSGTKPTLGGTAASKVVYKAPSATTVQIPADLSADKIITVASNSTIEITGTGTMTGNLTINTPVATDLVTVKGIINSNANITKLNGDIIFQNDVKCATFENTQGRVTFNGKVEATKLIQKADAAENQREVVFNGDITNLTQIEVWNAKGTESVFELNDNGVILPKIFNLVAKKDGVTNECPQVVLYGSFVGLKAIALKSDPRAASPKLPTTITFEGVVNVSKTMNLIGDIEKVYFKKDVTMKGTALVPGTFTTISKKSIDIAEGKTLTLTDFAVVNDGTIGGKGSVVVTVNDDASTGAVETVAIAADFDLKTPLVSQGSGIAQFTGVIGNSANKMVFKCLSGTAELSEVLNVSKFDETAGTIDFKSMHNPQDLYFTNSTDDAKVKGTVNAINFVNLDGKGKIDFSEVTSIKTKSFENNGTDVKLGGDLSALEKFRHTSGTIEFVSDLVALTGASSLPNPLKFEDTRGAVDIWNTNKTVIALPASATAAQTKEYAKTKYNQTTFDLGGVGGSKIIKDREDFTFHCPVKVTEFVNNSGSLTFTDNYFQYKTIEKLFGRDPVEQTFAAHATVAAPSAKWAITEIGTLVNTVETLTFDGLAKLTTKFTQDKGKAAINKEVEVANLVHEDGVIDIAKGSNLFVKKFSRPEKYGTYAGEGVFVWDGATAGDFDQGEDFEIRNIKFLQDATPEDKAWTIIESIYFANNVDVDAEKITLGKAVDGIKQFTVVQEGNGGDFKAVPTYALPVKIQYKGGSNTINETAKYWSKGHEADVQNVELIDGASVTLKGTARKISKALTIGEATTPAAFTINNGQLAVLDSAEINIVNGSTLSDDGELTLGVAGVINNKGTLVVAKDEILTLGNNVTVNNRVDLGSTITIGEKTNGKLDCEYTTDTLHINYQDFFTGKDDKGGAPTQTITASALFEFAKVIGNVYVGSDVDLTVLDNQTITGTLECKGNLLVKKGLDYKFPRQPEDKVLTVFGKTTLDTGRTIQVNYEQQLVLKGDLEAQLGTNLNVMGKASNAAITEGLTSTSTPEELRNHGKLIFAGKTGQTFTFHEDGRRLSVLTLDMEGENPVFNIPVGELTIGSRIEFHNGIVNNTERLILPNPNAADVTDDGLGFNRDNIEGKKVGHIAGVVRRHVATKDGSGNNGRFEYPVGTLAGEYRASQITFTSEYPAENPAHIDIQAKDAAPTGVTGFPIDGGNGVTIGDYPQLHWWIKTYPGSFTNTQKFDIEFQAHNIQYVYSDYNDIRLIRRQDGDAVTNGWVMQGEAPRYENYQSVKPETSDTSLVIRASSTSGGLVQYGTLFTYGMPSQGALFVAPKFSEVKMLANTDTTVQFNVNTRQVGVTVKSYTVEGADFAKINAATGLVTLTPTTGHVKAAPYKLVVTATLTNNEVLTRGLDVTVTKNEIPVDKFKWLSELKDTTIFVGQTLKFVYKAVAPVGTGDITYGFVPPFDVVDAAIDLNTGIFSWKPLSAEKFPVVITVFAAKGTDTLKTFAKVTVLERNVSVAGKLLYANASKAPIANAEVSIWQATEIKKVKSAADGTYSMADLPIGEYTLKATKDGDWLGGVTAADALLAARGAVGAVELNELQKLVADVNGDGNVTSADALLILQRVVGIIDDFTAADWQFVPTTAKVTGDVGEMHILVGALAGDVNLSYQPEVAKEQTVELFKEGEKQIALKSEFELPVKIKSAEDLSAFSFRFAYPEEKVELVSVQSQFQSLVANAKDGQLSVAWADFTGKNAITAGKDAVIVLKFKATEGFKKADVAELNFEDGEAVDMLGKEVVANLSVASVKASVPQKFALKQNYPNPFNPTTTIAYDLPVSGKVTVKVYNTLGQEVATLVNEIEEAGSYEKVWDASNVSSGVYILAIRVEGSKTFVQTKKMTLLK